MPIEDFRLLAGIIAAHPNRELIGRTRLQKTVRLLQRIGLPVDYDYTTHFYGPYSEGVQADIGLLESIGMVTEISKTTAEGAPFYILRAKPECQLKQLEQFSNEIKLMSQTDTVLLELAATYDAFREQGDSHAEALKRVKRKKGPKCDDGRLERSLELLGELNLSNS